MSCYACGARKEHKTGSSAEYYWAVVDAMDHGRLVTVASSFFLSCVAEINWNFL